MLGWVATAFAQDCPAGDALDALRADLQAGEDGYAALDSTAFRDGLDRAALELPCVRSPIPPEVAADLHLLVGLRAWADGREADADRSFAAARAADPSLEIPAAVVPEGHEVRARFLAAEPGGAEAIPTPAEGEIRFDGHPALTRPADRPSVVQVVHYGGAVASTGYLLPADPLPAYDAAPEPSFAPDPPVLPRPRRPGWLVAGGVGAVGSAVLYGLAAHSAAQFAGPLPADDGRDELLALRARTNALVAASVVSGGVAIAGFAGFAVRW